jgi:high-affinity nickel-transport protein
MTRSFSRRLILLYAALLAGNAAAWAWAFALFGGNAALMGTALLAYALGLRHAVDADHIAAIDNTTRKLVQDGQRPLGVGLYFSLGHSSVVALASAAIALASLHLGRLEWLHGIGATIGTAVSASFLFLIAAANIVTLMGILKAMRGNGDLPALPGGPLGRMLKPLMRLVSRSWHLYPLGFLFGLGFDTASEIGLLGISAAQASHAVPFWSIMVFPALFTAGMSLIDTTDGVLMTGAYGWALLKPARKLVYNLTVTLFSILVALVIGALEALNLLAGRMAWDGPLWRFIAGLNAHFGALGFATILGLTACWAASVLMAKSRA